VKKCEIAPIFLFPLWSKWTRKLFHFNPS